MRLTDSRRFYITCFILVLLLLALNCAYAGATRNVIIMIGDGMSYQHVNAGSYYLSGTAGTLCFEPYYKCGVTTRCLDYTVHPITDSAAAASAIATGHKVNYLTVSQSPAGTAYQTILEFAKGLGKRTGLVGTDPITRATPAAFGAHDPDRNNLIAIGDDFLNSSRPDVLMGGGGTASGGSAYFSTAQIAAAQGLGYQTAYTKTQMNALSTSASRVLGLFSTNEMTYEYDRPVNTTEPHLSEMTTKALSLLNTDPDGFFLMVEGAKIDYAAHANDIIRTTKEVVEFNNSVQAVLNWMQGRTDTLLIVTGDHDTGGLTATNRGAGTFPGATWSTTGHTATNVPLYAYGVNAGIVSNYIQGGVMDNTDVYRVMRKAYDPAFESIPCKIYEQIYAGGHGSVYYVGAVVGDTAYTGQIGWTAMQWGDQQINGNALLNHTPDGLTGSPAAPVNNIAKCAIPMNGFPAAGGWLYMVNGANYIYRTASWDCDNSTLTQVTGTPAVAECICTDGTYIYMTTGASASGYNNVWKISVNHSTGVLSTVAGWPKPIGSSATHRFRGISYYNGKLYLANFKKTGEIYEMDANTGDSTLLVTTPTYWGGANIDSHYQVVRYGNKLYCVGLDCNLYTYNYIPGTPASAVLESTFATGYTYTSPYGLFGIGVKGDGTTAKYAWITAPGAAMSFWDLDPQWTSGSIGDARKGKNGYPVIAQNAVVTKTGSDEFWVEDKDRASAARVTGCTTIPAIGKLVTLKGGMSSTESGEKVFNAIEVTEGAVADPAIKPVYLSNKSMGPAAISAGLASDGMLVTVGGKVTHAVFGGGAADVFFIDDGSGVPCEVAGVKGVKVTAPDMMTVPWYTELWQAAQYPFISTVTGIVRLDKQADGTITPKIQAFNNADVHIIPLF